MSQWRQLRLIESFKLNRLQDTVLNLSSFNRRGPGYHCPSLATVLTTGGRAEIKVLRGRHCELASEQVQEER